MSKRKSRLKLAQELAESAVAKTNEKIGELGIHTSQLFNVLNIIQDRFDDIRNVPSEKQLAYEKLNTIRLNWKQHAETIELDYKNTASKHTGKGIAGLGSGVALASLGPTAAMGIATSFGVASTGTAISSLSGVAATKAALAWLGGGTLAAGGGGIAAGNAFLALAGPVGWAIAGVALLGSGFFLWLGKSDQNRLEDIFDLISKRDVKSYELTYLELNERIDRIVDESQKLELAIDKIETFGRDYHLMTEAQQYELGSYLNLMNASIQLLVNPIAGLQSKFDESDLKQFLSLNNRKKDDNRSALIIYLANLLYGIDLDDKDKKLLWKSFKRNKTFLSSIGISKKEFDFSILDTTTDSLSYKYCSDNR